MSHVRVLDILLKLQGPYRFSLNPHRIGQVKIDCEREVSPFKVNLLRFPIFITFAQGKLLEKIVRPRVLNCLAKNSEVQFAVVNSSPSVAYKLVLRGF
jgi:hypothetical protein